MVVKLNNSAVNIMLTDNDIKEELSYAYIHAVAARTGMALDYRRKDRDSVDVIISSRRKTVSDYELCSISLELQVKATVVSDFSAEEFSFELPIKNYNDLRVKTLCPRLLVVFVMPLINTLWVSTSENDLTLRRCAYWHNLKGEPSVENTRSKTVWISRKNLFTPEALNAMMSKIARQEEIGHEL